MRRGVGAARKRFCIYSKLAFWLCFGEARFRVKPLRFSLIFGLTSRFPSCLGDGRAIRGTMSRCAEDAARSAFVFVLDWHFDCVLGRPELE